MCVIFTIKEEARDRWGIYRGSDLLISQPSLAGAITDARELARLVHAHKGTAVTVALATPGASILLARYALQAASASSVAA